jgi:hypothetical protein
MPFEPAQIDLTVDREFDRGGWAGSYAGDCVRAVDNPLSKKKTYREIVVRPGCSHRDGDRFAHKKSLAAKAKDDFKRFLDRELVENPGWGIFRKITIDPETVDTGRFVLRKKRHAARLKLSCPCVPPQIAALNIPWTGIIVQRVLISDFEICHLFVSEGHNFVGHHQRAPGTYAMAEVPELVCVAGKGIVGDRYFGFRENYKGQITFFQQEVHDELCARFGVWDRGPEVYRRNVITRGVCLNDLIGTEFELQGVRFFGKEECRPCYWMDSVFSSGAENALKGRGGLRAQILTGGLLQRTKRGKS